MAGQGRFFDAVDPFNLADWEVQNGPSPSRTKQRAQCLDKNGDELMHTQFGTQDSGTIVYKARFGKEHMCVGCGRCISKCPAHLDIAEFIDSAAEVCHD